MAGIPTKNDLKSNTKTVSIDLLNARLADAIDLALRHRGRYHVDQIAVHYALQWRAAHGRPLDVVDVGMRWSDSDFAPDALIWSTRGPRKCRFEELRASLPDPVKSR